MAIDAGTLEIRMLMGLARLQEDVTKATQIVGSGMSTISQSVAQAKSVLATLGVGLSVGALVLFAKHTLDAIAHMKDLGQEAGTTASAISRFEAPARMAGSSLDFVAAAMFKLSKAALEAKDPQSKAAQALNAIGISTAQLKGLKPDEMFELVARQSAKYSDGLSKNAVMMELVAKSGREMNKVAAEIAEKGALVATVTDEEAEAADRLQDQMVELQMNSEKFWRSLANAGVPALNDILKAFIDARKEGSLLDAVIQALSRTFDALGGTDTLAGQLKNIDKEINEQITLWNNLKKSREGLFGFTGADDASIANVEAQIKAMNVARGNILKLIDEARKVPVVSAARKPEPEFDPAAAAKAAAAAALATAAALAAKKASDDLIGSLEKELATVNDLSGGDKKLIEVLEKIDKLKRDGKPVDEAKITALAIEIDLANKLIKTNEFLAAQNQANIDAAAGRGTAQEEMSNSWAEATEQLQMELSLVGKSNDARQRALLLEKARLDIIAAGGNAAVVRDINAALALQLGLIGKISAAQKLANLPAEMAAAWRKAGDDIGESLTRAFGAGGAAAGKMFKAFSDGIAVQIELDDQYAKAKEEVGADLATLEKKHQDDTTQNSLKSYGDMAGAAASFFDKQSTAYKVLSGIEKAMYLVKFAMQAQAMVMDLTATGASVANSGTRASADGIAAFAKTLSSLQYPYNLVAGATVLAALAGVGVAIAGGGGGGSHEAGSVARQRDQGTGTVLGDTSAKSESIVNALEDVRDNSDDDLLYTSAMLASLRAIESSMSGLAQLAARIGLTGQDAVLPGAGGGNTFSLDDAGIILGRYLEGSGNSEHAQFTGQSVGGLIADPGATRYTDIAREHSGMFGSTYTAVNRDFEDLGDQFASQISHATIGIRDTLASAIQILTGSTHSIEDIQAALNTINIDAHTISFAGLKGDEIQSAIEAVFGAIGDDMAAGIMSLDIFSDDSLDALAEFQHVGEGAFETIVRVASGVERASAVLGQWGIAIIDWRDVVDTQGDVTTELIRGSIVAAQTTEGVTSALGLLVEGFDGSADDMIQFYQKLQDLNVLLRASAINTELLSQAMITGAGGLSALTSGLETYADRFFTQAEKDAAAAAEVQASFTRLGFAMPATRAGFRAMVEAAQAAGDEGLVGALLAVAPAFDAVATSVEDAAQRAREAWADVDDMIGQLTGRGDGAAGRFATATGQLASQNAAFGGMSPAQVLNAITHMTEVDFSHYDEATQELIRTILGLAIDMQHLDKTVQTITVGDVQSAAMSTAAAWLERIKGVFSGEDYATNQGHIQAAIVDQIAAAQAHLLEVQSSHRDAAGNMTDRDASGAYYADIVEARIQLREYQAQLASLGVDMARYYVLEAANPGHGRGLMELEDWYHQQQGLLGSNHAALLALDEIYQQRRLDILAGANDTALSAMQQAQASLGDYLSELLLGDKSPLGPMERLGEAQAQYERMLALAQGGDLAGIQGLQGAHSAYIDIARQLFGSSSPFIEIFERTFNEVAGVAGVADYNTQMLTISTMTNKLLENIAASSLRVEQLLDYIASTTSESGEKVANAVENSAVELR